MRTDAEYLIWIEAVSPDGKLQARYSNPQPIQVSRAEATREDGKLRIVLELRDRNYPGNYYTLTYDPKGDSLYGRYNHLGLNQVFDVSFYRFGGGPPKPQAGR